jgi:hypothetical protein
VPEEKEEDFFYSTGVPDLEEWRRRVSANFRSCEGEDATTRGIGSTGSIN